LKKKEVGGKTFEWRRGYTSVKKMPKNWEMTEGETIRQTKKKIRLGIQKKRPVNQPKRFIGPKCNELREPGKRKRKKKTNVTFGNKGEKKSTKGSTLTKASAKSTVFSKKKKKKEVKKQQEKIEDGNDLEKKLRFRD